MSGGILVTGGAGFIGSGIVEALNRRGRDDIIIVDDLGCDDKWTNLRDLRFADFLSIEEFARRLYDEELPDVELVIHEGACSATTERDADYLMENNTLLTRDLCRGCLERGARFVYASSAATYGDGSRGYSDDHGRITELEPLNMYGYSKHLFDLWALREGWLDRIAGLKYFNVYGPREAHKGDMRSMIHKAFGQVLKTGSIALFKSYRDDIGDGAQVRDFVYLDDAVEQTLFLADHPNVNGLFNCGTGAARSWNDLAEAVFAAMGREVNIRYIDMPESIRDRYQYHTEADMTKIRAAGFDRPFLRLEEGVRRYWEKTGPDGGIPGESG
jgi:ADP-L-glycero-D-manno-heptose 6-epimerase